MFLRFKLSLSLFPPFLLLSIPFPPLSLLLLKVAFPRRLLYLPSLFNNDGPLLSSSSFSSYCSLSFFPLIPITPLF